MIIMVSSKCSNNSNNSHMINTSMMDFIRTMMSREILIVWTYHLNLTRVGKNNRWWSQRWWSWMICKDSMTSNSSSRIYRPARSSTDAPLAAKTDSPRLQHGLLCPCPCRLGPSKPSAGLLLLGLLRLLRLITTTTTTTTTLQKVWLSRLTTDLL